MICVDKPLGYLGVLSTNPTQTTEELNLPLTIHEIKRSPEFDAILLGEVARFWECKKAGKQFRVSRKESMYWELRLRYQVRKIYG